MSEYNKNPNEYFIQTFQPMGVFDNSLYKFHKDLKNYQPSGSSYENSLNDSPIMFYKEKYGRYTDFTLKKLDNKKSDFGKIFSFSPLNDYCNSDFEKENAKLCIKHYPNDWNCVYENCISLSRTTPYHINIILMPI